MAEMKQIYTVDVWTAKTISNIVASPDIYQCQKLPFQLFTSLWICPLQQSASSSWLKFWLENNSTVVWLYAGGVSLILPDVRFETVPQDWVMYDYQFDTLAVNINW